MPLTKTDLKYLFAIHKGEHVDRSRRETADLFDPKRAWVDGESYTLSDRIWNQKQNIRRRMDMMISDAITKGDSPLDLAKGLEQYLNPEFAPTRTENGRIRRRGFRIRDEAGNIIQDGRTQVLTLAPYGSSGAGSYPARRLARTEVTAAHGRAVNEASRIADAATKWNLSNRHPKTDICDKNAAGSSTSRTGKGRLPRGTYWPDELPTYPAHPMCLCGLTTVDPRSDDEIIAAIRRDTGLDTFGTPNDVLDISVDDPDRIQERFGLKPIDETDPEYAKDFKRRAAGLPDNYTEAQAREVGRIARAEYDRRLQELVNPLGLNDDGLFELRSYKAWMQNARRSGITDEQQQAYLFRANRSLDRLERRFGLKPGQATRIDLMEPGDARKLAFRETMDPLRKMNGPATRLKHVGTFDESALNAIDDASYYFPESWWNKAGDYIGADGGTIDLIRTPRGYFMQRPTGPDVAKLIGKPKTTIALSGELVDTAIHELMHLMQHSVFGISRLEKQFYARRVKGERLKKMPGYGYSTSEKTRADAFYHPYVGKDYGSGGIKDAEPREVATMGIEGLNGMQTGNRTLSEIDEEHADLIFSMFGLLP